jgi:hypothetical protein
LIGFSGYVQSKSGEAIASGQVAVTWRARWRHRDLNASAGLATPLTSQEENAL